jgi:hypothetical protein
MEKIDYRGYGNQLMKCGRTLNRDRFDEDISLMARTVNSARIVRSRTMIERCAWRAKERL